MKKARLTAWILAAVLCVGTALSGCGSTEEITDEDVIENESLEEEDEEPEEEISDFPAEYDGCSLDVTNADTDGEYITVYATYTNDNSEPSYAFNSFKLKVFQGGISLDDASNFAGDEASQMKEIKDGASYDVSYKFKLENDDEIEIMACAPTGDQDILAETFYSLSELEASEETEEAAEEESDEIDEAADEEVTVEKAEEIDESQGVELAEGYNPVELGGSITLMGEASFEMSFDSFDFESEISYSTGEHFTTNITSHDGNQLAVLRGRMENNSSFEISDLAFDLSFVANGEYEYDSVKLIFESNHSSKIEPLSEEVFDIYAEVPDKMVDQFETGVFYISYKQDMSSITYTSSYDSNGDSMSYTDADFFNGVIVQQEQESVTTGSNEEINDTENIIAGPLTLDDFIVSGDDVELISEYDYNIINFFNASDDDVVYNNYIEGVSWSKEDAIKTARGITLGSSLDEVVAAYGPGIEHDFTEDDLFYQTISVSDPTGSLLMTTQCSTYIAYTYEDGEHEYQIVFYFDENKEVSWIVYSSVMYAS